MFNDKKKVKFVISINTANNRQVCPTIAINPEGEILKEIISSETQYFCINLDISIISDWYINQSRKDLIEIKYIKK